MLKNQLRMLFVLALCGGYVLGGRSAFAATEADSTGEDLLKNLGQVSKERLLEILQEDASDEDKEKMVVNTLMLPDALLLNGEKMKLKKQWIDGKITRAELAEKQKIASNAFDVKQVAQYARAKAMLKACQAELEEEGEGTKYGQDD